MFHQIIYTSAALPSATLADFKSIAEHARESNQKVDVTGILLYSDGVILQVLEGAKDTVEPLYDKIRRDRRHSSVMRMISRSAEHREFPQWSMGFAQMGKEHVSELAFILTKDSLVTALPPVPSTELSVLSKTYARVNGL